MNKVNHDPNKFDVDEYGNLYPKLQCEERECEYCMDGVSIIYVNGKPYVVHEIDIIPNSVEGEADGK